MRIAIQDYPSRKIPADERLRIEAPLKPASEAVEIAKQAVERATTDYRAFDFMHEVTVWLKRAAQFGLTMKHSPLPTATAGDPIAAVEAVRAELKALAEERISVEQASAPVEDLKGALAAEVNRLALEGLPRLDFRHRGLAPVDVRAALRAAVSPGGKVISDNATVFLIWLLRDQLLESLNTLIDVYAPEQSLSDAEQAAEIDKIDKRIAELQWHEEAIISAAAGRGQVIARRRDLDPRMFLEVIEQ